MKLKRIVWVALAVPLGRINLDTPVAVRIWVHLPLLLLRCRPGQAKQVKSQRPLTRHHQSPGLEGRLVVVVDGVFKGRGRPEMWSIFGVLQLRCQYLRRRLFPLSIYLMCWIQTRKAGKGCGLMHGHCRWPESSHLATAEATARVVTTLLCRMCSQPRHAKSCWVPKRKKRENDDQWLSGITEASWPKATCQIPDCECGGQMFKTGGLLAPGMALVLHFINQFDNENISIEQAMRCKLDLKEFWQHRARATSTSHWCNL